MTSPPLNYDTLITSGKLSQREAEIFGISAEFLLDGVRLGGVDFEMASASVHDGDVAPKRAEVEAAAHILARLGFTDAQIFTFDPAGIPLERPDLDIVVAGDRWGFEVACGIEPSVAKADAEENRIQIAIRDLLDSDPEFAAELGAAQLTVRLESDGQPLSRSVGNKIIEELQRFIRSGDHHRDTEGDFGPAYPALRARGAWHRLLESEAPYFMAIHGSTTVDRSDRSAVVVATLDRHRKSAATYRHVRNWFAIHVTDVFDIFRGTLTRIEEMRPPIAPFERAFVMNAMRRIIALDDQHGRCSTTEIPY